MTKSSFLVWGLMMVLVAALTVIMSGCGNNGPTAPGNTDVKDYSSGDVDGEAYTALMAKYATLKAAGGGTMTVEAQTQTLIGVTDRWLGTGINALVLITGADGSISTTNTTGVFVTNGLVYPITVNVWADGYVSQTIVETDANIIVFELERINWGLGSTKIYGIGTTQVGAAPTSGLPLIWRTIGMNTQDFPYSVATTGTGTNPPYTILDVCPQRPYGAVVWKYKWDGDTISSPTLPPDMPLEDFQLVGYSYDDLGMLFAGSIGSWIMNFTTVEEMNTYTDGNFSLTPQQQGNNAMLASVIHFSGGTTLVDSREFVANTPQFVKYAPGDDGTYSLESVNLPVAGDRSVVRANIIFPSGATEDVFANWDPSGSTLPDIEFGVPPVIDDLWYDFQQNAFVGSWSNNSAGGLLKLTFYVRNTPIWVVYLDNDTTSIPEGVLAMAPNAVPFYRMATADLTRISCPDVSLGNFSDADIWGEATSFATSLKFKMTTTDSLN
jgi:hypothetical protein